MLLELLEWFGFDTSTIGISKCFLQKSDGITFLVKLYKNSSFSFFSYIFPIMVIGNCKKRIGFSIRKINYVITSERKRYYEQTKRMNFFLLNKLSIMVIENCLKNWIQHKKYNTMNERSDWRFYQLFHARTANLETANFT